MLARAGQERLYFHETCMAFGVLFGRKDPPEARFGAWTQRLSRTGWPSS
jgi:hypothetical protein